MFIALNYTKIITKRLEELSNIKFLSEKNHNFKMNIVNLLEQGHDNVSIQSKINSLDQEILREIIENSNIQIIIKNKSDSEISDLLEELFQDHKEQRNLKKIESLERKLINNLDENSYSELIRLKSQLNRE